jgi:hypothetical protein
VRVERERDRERETEKEGEEKVTHLQERHRDKTFSISDHRVSSSSPERTERRK